MEGTSSSRAFHAWPPLAVGVLAALSPALSSRTKQSCEDPDGLLPFRATHRSSEELLLHVAHYIEAGRLTKANISY